MWMQPPKAAHPAPEAPTESLIQRRAFVSRLESPEDLRSSLGKALRWLRVNDRVTVSNPRIFVKPNLTWPEPTPGVTTRPEFIDAAVEVLRDFSSRIVIGESDGGYGSYKAEEAFEGHGIYQIASRHGVQVQNLSQADTVTVRRHMAGREVELPLPRLLVEEVDLFVTLPVPKVHAMTGVSLGLKNQWGCLPDVMRLRNHAEFDHKIVAINELLRPALALYDGKYFLDVNGPIHGEPIQMDLMIASSDVGAGDAVCCEIMGIDPAAVAHLVAAREAGIFPSSLAEVQVNRPPRHFHTHRFRVRRHLVNRIALAAFRRGWLTMLLYDSPLADPLHAVLYALRGQPLIGRLLYGRLGPPPAQGKRG